MEERKSLITPAPKLEIYKDEKGEWRWTIKMLSRIVGASTEGYKNRQDCVDNLLNLGKRIERLKSEGKIV